MSQSTSKPSRMFTPQEKLVIINRVQNGETKASVARDVGVAESTLRGWCKNGAKISYLSEKRYFAYDEEFEPKKKISKLDEASSSVGETKFPIRGNRSSPKSKNNLSEKTKDNLAKLSLEMNIRTPFSSNCNTNDLLLSQWNELLLQKIKNSYKSEHNLTPNNIMNHSLYRTGQEVSLNQYSNSVSHPLTNNAVYFAKPAIPSTSLNMNEINSDRSSWFWNWFKEVSFKQQEETKTILYQQLTRQITQKESIISKDKNPSATNNNQKPDNDKTGPKVRAVLDNLLCNNDNLPCNKEETEENNLSQCEAIEHGEKFLKWLETHSNPSFTAVQIIQFKTLLKNVKSGIDRKNCDLVHKKTKIKRK